MSDSTPRGQRDEGALQRDKGKHHNAAVIAVARKRCAIIWAVLTNRTPYKKSLTT